MDNNYRSICLFVLTKLISFNCNLTSNRKCILSKTCRKSCAAIMCIERVLYVKIVDLSVNKIKNKYLETT